MEEKAFNAEVSRLIREARKQAGLTQELLARRTGMSRGSITNIEAGTQTPPLYRLARIAAVLNVQPADLLPHLREEASGLPARYADDVASVWSAAIKLKDADGQG
ncbi:helix-turn-helix transcriptional regulator [Streptomyces pactum]|uniref:Helix-turn-helix transcriptional regulator n=1 Tax=Streptomyces pactum TaxID=68249 RepID=A0ABS0NLP8_9ACTN|nr:helix-turn-helix transcriptional regulator [Streptomyces pactum]MBH5336117.1 helix-turn-helix transcriptional regulator [Streptomyces pactum]